MRTTTLSLNQLAIQFIEILRNLIAMVLRNELPEQLPAPTATTEQEVAPTPQALEHCAAEAIRRLQQQKKIRYKYDYIWLMQAYNELQPEMPFASPRDFVHWLRRQKVQDPPSESQLYRHYFHQEQKFPDWHFKDDKGKTMKERDRRMSLVESFFRLLGQETQMRQEK